MQIAASLHFPFLSTDSIVTWAPYYMICPQTKLNLCDQQIHNSAVRFLSRSHADHYPHLFDTDREHEFSSSQQPFLELVPADVPTRIGIIRPDGNGVNYFT
jgi:hypothetical protein